MKRHFRKQQSDLSKQIMAKKKTGTAVTCVRSSKRVSVSPADPSSMYDFMSESLQHQGKPDIKDLAKSKNTAKTKVKAVKKFGKISAKEPKKSKVQLSEKKKEATPKRTLRQSKQACGNAAPAVIIKCPISTPSLDNISPIIKQNTGRHTNESKRKLRSSDVNIETPAVSFAEAQQTPASKDDSAIFISPRKTMPRFDDEKTSTPASFATKQKTKPLKRVLKTSTVTNTSTPDEPKPKRAYTKIIEKNPVPSPAERVETPTSDYASMDSSILTPSPPKPKSVRRKRESSPAFTLEEQDIESPSLNKSMDDKMYKKSKKKYKSHKESLQASKVEEWAEKVNSELEDVENFELSIED
ncbi:nucleolar protein dao-5-like [Mya arenaria]|uniref:nucleolar protein dao-5-like n=1 Tax=Mya arenaria TaxID=6604 RepID=UPI0022E4B419|nr:nucleolar protein dao-5-like [Mya arenaria]